MKLAIFRKNCIVLLLASILFSILLFVSFINCFNPDSKLLQSILGTCISFALSMLFLWGTFHSYLQIISFKKSGIYVNKGFRAYLHYEYKSIKKVKIVTFASPPTYPKGYMIRGVDSIIPAPKNRPTKWIVLSDGRKEDNISNYNSYLVPIRRHMVIKLEHSEARERLIFNLIDAPVEHLTISYEDMVANTPSCKRF